jgi:peroxiredoxin
LIREIVVPPGSEELDLGSFDLPLTGNEVAPGPMVDFKAMTFEGRSFDLSGLRGKPVAILFWARWAPQSALQLADLRKTSAEMSTNAGIALVTVNFDERSDLARDLVADLPGKWTHLRLAGPANYSVTEEWKIDTLPTLIIVDAEGRVAARDVSAKRLGSVMERMLRKSAKR